MRRKFSLRAAAWGFPLWLAIPGAVLMAAGSVTYHEIGGTVANGGTGADALKDARISPERRLKEAVSYLPPGAAGSAFAVCATREGRFYGPFPAGATEVEIRTNGDVVVTGWQQIQTVERQGVEAETTAQGAVTEKDVRQAAASQVASTALEYLIARHGGLVQVLTSRKRTLGEVLELARRLKLDLNVPIAALFTRLVELRLITAEHRAELLGRLQQSAVFQGIDIFQDNRTVLDLFDRLISLDVYVDLAATALVQLLQEMGIDVETFLREWLSQVLSALLVQNVGAEQTVGQVLTAWGLPASQIDIRELNVDAIRQALQQVVVQWAQETERFRQGLVVEVSTSGPRLEVQKAVGLNVAYPGLEIPYVLTCRNVGDITAEDVTVIDILPANTEVARPPARSPLVESFVGTTPEGVAYLAWRCKKPMKPMGTRGAVEVRIEFGLRAVPGKWTPQRVRTLREPA